MKVKSHVVHFLTVLTGISCILVAYYKKQIVMGMFPTVVPSALEFFPTTAGAAGIETLEAAIVALLLTLFWAVGPVLTVLGIFQVLLTANPLSQEKNCKTE